MINVSGLTLTYKSGKGVLDLNFTVPDGIVAGYLGPNGVRQGNHYKRCQTFSEYNSGVARF